MNWADLYADDPLRMEGQIPVFGLENDGDYFDADDIAEWRGGRLLSNWRDAKLLENPVIRRMLEQIVRDEAYAVDLACGPGMGLLPSLNQLKPGFAGLATDANLSVLLEWRRVLDGLDEENIALAQCSLMALPFRENTVRAYTSMIGLSSTRGGEEGIMTALSEVYRTLAPGGKLYTVEAEWTDVSAILDLFAKMGRRPWDIFLQPQCTWYERFIRAGFNILREEVAECTHLRPEDNDLGQAATAHGVQVGQKRTAFILQK